jgi:hypothetical protein
MCDRARENVMSEVIYLKAIETPAQSRTVKAHMAPGPQVYIREAYAGMWIVHDESDRKGGCFRTHEAALRFTEEEFGPSAQIVVQPHFSASSRKSVSHFRQTASVAHRAIASH